MKKIQIPFDLSKIDKDTRIETKNGYEVEILKTNMRGNYPIVGIVKRVNEKTDLVEHWTKDGYYLQNNSSHAFNLVIVKEYLNWWDTHNKDRFEQYLINGYDEPENHYITLNNARYPSTPELALQHYAFAQISHILKNDFSYGGIISNAEWNNYDIDKYCIYAWANEICLKKFKKHRHFLAFHSEEAARKFLEEYPELVKQYLGIEDDIEL